MAPELNYVLKMKIILRKKTTKGCNCFKSSFVILLNVLLNNIFQYLQSMHAFFLLQFTSMLTFFMFLCRSGLNSLKMYVTMYYAQLQISVNVHNFMHF